MVQRDEFNLPPFQAVADGPNVRLATANGAIVLTFSRDGSVTGRWAELRYRPKTGLIRQVRPPQSGDWTDPVWFNIDALKACDEWTAAVTAGLLRYIAYAAAENDSSANLWFDRVRLHGDPHRLWDSGTCYLSWTDLVAFQANDPERFSHAVWQAAQGDRDAEKAFRLALTFLKLYIES